MKNFKPFNAELLQVLLLVVIVLVLTPVISSNAAAIDTSITIATYSIIAISLSMSYGMGGMLSFAQGAFAAIGAYATAIFTLNLGLHPLLGLPLAIVVPMLMAYFIARLVVRMSPLALGLATLALGELIELLLNEGGNFTGAYIGLSGIEGLVPSSQWLGLHLLSWAIVVLVLLGYVRLRNSNKGRALQSLSVDVALSKSVGIRPVKELTALFAAAGAVAGLGGWFYAHTRTYLSPTSLSMDLSFMVAIAVVLGGRRSLLGAVLGTAVIVILRDILPGSELHGMFYGLALVITLLLFPEGILGINWRKLLPRHKFNNDYKKSVEEVIAK